MADTKIWGIHAGQLGEVDSLFRDKSLIAIGWHNMGDLSKFKVREEYKTEYSKVYPNSKAGAIPTNAGQLFRFVHEMKEGDLVIYPSRTMRRIWLGRVTGPYTHRPEIDSKYPNHRKVEWLKDLPRTHFSQGALYEIGSAMSLFQVRTYAEEFISALTGKSSPTPVAGDATLAAVAEGIEQSTRDFILKKLSQELKGLPLEDFIAHLLTRMGYRARPTRTNTASVDLIAHKDELGLEPPIIKVQVKSGDGKISDKDVSALYGKLNKDEFGLVVTLGEFSEDARNFAGSKGNLRLINGTELVDVILEHYEAFDSRYKGLLPLRRVYVPEPTDDLEE